jgi:hypothetical protein
VVSAEGYKVWLTGRQEVVAYRDASGHYQFDAFRRGKIWEVVLPPSRGQYGEPDYELDHELTGEEQRRIFPRIESYLLAAGWFEFTRARQVRFVPEGPPHPLRGNFAIQRLKNGVRYSDKSGSFRFRYRAEGTVWLVELSAEDRVRWRMLSAEERGRIWPRIEMVLLMVRQPWRWFTRMTAVRFVEG